jgi:hypothetical protein
MVSPLGTLSLRGIQWCPEARLKEIYATMMSSFTTNWTLQYSGPKLAQTTQCQGEYGSSPKIVSPSELFDRAFNLIKATSVQDH